jgi:parallel beta-helix repeat protein
MAKSKTIAALIAIIVIIPAVMLLGCVEKETSVSTPTPSPTITPILDSDGDGWNDEQEKIAGTDPYKKDTDSDGYWDPNDPNPLDPNIPVSKISPTPIPTIEATPTPKEISKLPKTIYVDDDFEDEPVNHRWNTIQEGINDAEDGDTIIVHGGIYYENIIVDKSITLKGINYPVLDAGQSWSAIRITADNCKVSGFKVTKSTFGIEVISDNNIIEDNTISQNTDGILLDHSSNNVIINNTLYANYRGISLSSSGSNQISSNLVNSNEYDGIVLNEGSDNNIIIHNTANSNGIGIILYNSNKNIIANNIANFNHFGVCLLSSYDNTIKNNIANLGESIGIHLDESSNNNIHNNTVDSNAWDGIRIERSSNNIISKNIVKSNNINGICMLSSYSNLLYRNNLIDNKQNAKEDTAMNSWDNGEEGNYWSDYTGEDLDGNGIGDTPYLIPDKGKATDNYPLMKPVQ